MHATDRFPLYAAGNCCFITGRYELEPGERVIDLDIETEDVPEGRLCISETALRRMAHELGLDIPEADTLVEIDHLYMENQRLGELNDQLREAIAEVFDIAKFVNLAQRLADVS